MKLEVVCFRLQVVLNLVQQAQGVAMLLGIELGIGAFIRHDYMGTKNARVHSLVPEGGRKHFSYATSLGETRLQHTERRCRSTFRVYITCCRRVHDDAANMLQRRGAWSESLFGTIRSYTSP